MDRKEKSFDLVQDSAKLLVTLATGFVAFSVTFSKELDGFDLGKNWEKWLWTASWFLMLVSVGCGIWVLLGLTTALDPPGAGDDHEPTIRTPKVKKPFKCQIVFFGLGVVMLVAYGTAKIFS